MISLSACASQQKPIPQASLAPVHQQNEVEVVIQPSGNHDKEQDVEIINEQNGISMDDKSESDNDSEQLQINTCDLDRNADERLPNVSESDELVDTWLELLKNKTFMTLEDIHKHNQRFYDPWADLNKPLNAGEIQNNMKKRLMSYQEKFNNHELMFDDGSFPSPDDFDRPLREFMNAYPDASSVPDTKQYIILEDTPILCGPHDRHYIKTQNGEVRFSRNLCSLGRAQSRIEVIFTQADGMRFVRNGDIWGWLSPSAKLSPEIGFNDSFRLVSRQDTSRSYEEARWFTSHDISLDGLKIVKGSLLAGTSQQVWIAESDGFQEIPVSLFEKGDLIDTHRPLTRHGWIKTLFLFLHDPYGWGGYGGWRDCSALILDAVRSFGLNLPRNSAEQARNTSYYLNVEGMTDKDKLNTIKKAAETGIVLLHFKGHIMAWLGVSKDGHPLVLHAISEYLVPCDEGKTNETSNSTVVHNDRVSVSDLSLGKDTPRRSLMERITHVVVITGLTTTPTEGMKKWTPEEETLFSAFVERLFDYEDINRSWNNLGDILRDRDHNILYNSLGMDEDEALKLEPDCADLPYTLRAYFAWKRGLPMAVRKCSRGTDTKAPTCDPPTIHINHLETSVDSFQKYARYVMNFEIHSGNARTANDDSESDFYPVALTRQTLRPGTTYADPYGHLLMIAHYVPDTSDSPGVLYAVDAQPDGTITRKRFWRGNFLFAPEITSVGAGFKSFRPIACPYVASSRHAEKKTKQKATCTDQELHQLTNDELTSSSGFTPYSSEQQRIKNPDIFYERVDAAIHPIPLSIDDSINELTDALYESAKKRIQSVQNGDDYIRQNGSSKMIMPRGYLVFETLGPWEDFATPSRDMRILIAIDAVLKFPDSIPRNAERYKITREEAKVLSEGAREKLRQKLESQIMTYTNSNGDPVSISMWELTNRKEALEMAYHPADCNEIRWGAPEGSDEIKTCSRHASDSERRKMKSMRKWFTQRIRPPR